MSIGSLQYGHIAETAREQLGPPGSPRMHALSFAFTQLFPHPNRLRVLAGLLRLYQRTGLQAFDPPATAEEVAWDGDRCCRSFLTVSFNLRRSILLAIGKRRAKVAMLNGCVMPLTLR